MALPALLHAHRERRLRPQCPSSLGRHSGRVEDTERGEPLQDVGRNLLLQATLLVGIEPEGFQGALFVLQILHGIHHTGGDVLMAGIGQGIKLAFEIRRKPERDLSVALVPLGSPPRLNPFCGFRHREVPLEYRCEGCHDCSKCITYVASMHCPFEHQGIPSTPREASEVLGVVLRPALAYGDRG